MKFVKLSQKLEKSPKKYQGEIFRHLRPLLFNKKAGELVPLTNGGISFMFLPSQQIAEYNFWIYECPDIAPFSAKQAVVSLRRSVERGTVPWGTVELNRNEAILDTAIRFVISEQSALPSTVPEKTLKIILQNAAASTSQRLFSNNIKNTKEIYNEAN